jgi:RNA polymerase sigma-70 factor, ECF subfamily
MTFADDRELTTRFRAGDRSAFEELVRKYQDRIYSLCRYMVKDTQDAQDAAQDIFIRAYGNLKGYRPDASFYTWLYRIAVNTCLDYNKKPRPEPLEDETLLDSLPSASPSPEEIYQAKETGQLIEAALQKLPKNTRAVIVLKEIEGLSYEEIAATLQTSVGTVKSRISRGREELRKYLRNKL